MSTRSSNERAISILARREHSETELRQKLQQAGHDSDAIEKTLAWLQKHDLQNDQRFAEAFLRSRSQRGHGELKIRLEMKQRGIADEIVSHTFKQAEIDWFALVITVRCKRFGEQPPADHKDRAKQQRFLQQRGFTHEQITESFNLIT